MSLAHPTVPARSCPCSRPTTAMPPRVRVIVQTVAASRGLTAEDLLSRSRRVPIAEARAEVFWRLRSTDPRPSLPRIARWFGMDHTTVLAGSRRHAQALVQQVAADLAFSLTSEAHLHAVVERRRIR